MIIRKKRINSLDRYLSRVGEGEAFTFGTKATAENRDARVEVGFSEEWLEGETVLPTASGGPTSKKNAEGWEIVHKDQPMETAYREFEWTWEEWHGPYSETQSRVVYQPYQRYPRTQVPPPSLELSAVSTPEARMVAVAQTFMKGENEDEAKLAANLLLELFGEAEVLRGDLTSFTPLEVRKVNWEVLPAGEHPWQTLEPAVRDVLDNQGERKRGVYEQRWSKLAGYGPDFVAVGRAGFSGYLIFAFEDRDLYVLESAYYGNATYVLDRGWETLSTLTKAELLDGDLHRDRIVHRKLWDSRIRALFED